MLQLLIPAQTVILAPLRAVTVLARHVSDRSAENARLTRLAARLAVENARLRSLSRLDAAEAEETDNLVAAPIIARDIASMRRYFVVSRGRGQGIRPGTPALVPDGVVGKVVAVGEHQSLVQTILDPESRVAARLPRSGTIGLVRADRAGRNRVEFIEHDADVRLGDTVITSGLGGVFPSGLVVGRVTVAAERPAELFRHVELRPFVDFSRLEQIFLLRLPTREHDRDDSWLENLRPPEVRIPERE